MGWLLRLGLNRGLLGGSRIFTAVGVAAGAIRLLQKIAGTGEKTLYTHTLDRGEVLVVTNTDPK